MDGQVKLTDFGVAKAAMRLSLTIPGTLHGKVYYMSPEQVTGEECDPRADVFSLGVVAYEMLAGRRPFEGTSEVAVLDKVRRCDPPPLAEVAPWVPGSLASIVARALARDPADRYPTMEAFRQALSTYMLEAHTMVSARALAEFLEDLRAIAPERPPMAATPIRPGTPRSLDDVAASLLGQGPDNVQTPVPLDGGAGSPHTRTLASGVGESSRSRNRRDRARRVWPWMALAVGVVGLATGLWAWSRITDLSNNGRTGAPAIAEAAPAAGPGAGTEPRPAATPDVPPMPAAAASPIPAVAFRPAITPPSPPSPVAEVSGPRKVVLKSDPLGARVLNGERELGKTPLDVTVPAGGTLRLELLAERHGAKQVTLTSTSASTVHVSLPPAPGRVKFRFFPADAEVRIDDRTIETTGNLVDLELPAGAHVLGLTARNGKRSRNTPFDVAPGRTRALGTVELGEGGGAAPGVTTTLPSPTETP
jgi:serine/threonine-protein kinase